MEDHPAETRSRVARQQDLPPLPSGFLRVLKMAELRGVLQSLAQSPRALIRREDALPPRAEVGHALRKQSLHDAPPPPRLPLSCPSRPPPAAVARTVASTLFRCLPYPATAMAVAALKQDLDGFQHFQTFLLFFFLLEQEHGQRRVRAGGRGVVSQWLPGRARAGMALG